MRSYSGSPKSTLVLHARQGINFGLLAQASLTRCCWDGSGSFLIAILFEFGDTGYRGNKKAIANAWLVIAEEQVYELSVHIESYSVIETCFKRFK